MTSILSQGTCTLYTDNRWLILNFFNVTESGVTTTHARYTTMELNSNGLSIVFASTALRQERWTSFGECQLCGNQNFDVLVFGNGSIKNAPLVYRPNEAKPCVATELCCKLFSAVSQRGTVLKDFKPPHHQVFE